jgi:hypothetical protein
VPYVAPHVGGVEQCLRVSNTPVGPRWRSQIRDIVRREPNDLVNAHLPVPLLADCANEAARAARRPFVLTHHTGSMRKSEVLSDSVAEHTSGLSCGTRPPWRTGPLHHLTMSSTHSLGSLALRLPPSRSWSGTQTAPSPSRATPTRVLRITSSRRTQKEVFDTYASAIRKALVGELTCDRPAAARFILRLPGKPPYG